MINVIRMQGYEVIYPPVQERKITNIYQTMKGTAALIMPNNLGFVVKEPNKETIYKTHIVGVRSAIDCVYQTHNPKRLRILINILVNEKVKIDLLPFRFWSNAQDISNRRSLEITAMISLAKKYKDFACETEK